LLKELSAVNPWLNKLMTFSQAKGAKL